MPSNPMPSSMTLKLPNHRTSHATSPSGQDPPLETDARQHLDCNRRTAEFCSEQQGIDDELRAERNDLKVEPEALANRRGHRPLADGGDSPRHLRQCRKKEGGRCDGP